MSNEFQGVTFPQQRITPSDDALIRRAILPDGILSGCRISYSGSTLTMAAGQLLICGRQIRHPASQNWPIVDAKTGFARVVLTIDLTQTSTRETFEQVSTALQYADSQDGFPSLEQTDINTSGSKYQAVLAMVSLGSGGITGIVLALEKSRVDGINFKVLSGKNRPVPPGKQAAVWIPALTNVKSWVVSQNPPKGQAKLAWIRSGPSGIPVNVGSVDGVIMAYPQYACLWAEDRWMPQHAELWDGSSWQQLYPNYLYFRGQEFPEVTGGWSVASISSAKILEEAQKLGDCIRLDADQPPQRWIAIATGFIDMTHINAIKVRCSITGSAGDKRFRVYITDRDFDHTVIASVESNKVEINQMLTLNVADITGSHMVALAVFIPNSTTGHMVVDVHEVSYEE